MALLLLPAVIFPVFTLVPSDRGTSVWTAWPKVAIGAALPLEVDRPAGCSRR